MAKIVCEGCGRVIGQSDTKRDVAAGFCDTCRPMYASVAKLQDECRESKKAVLKVTEGDGCCELVLMGIGGLLTAAAILVKVLA